MERGDRALIERIAVGDDLALAAAYDLHGPVVYGIAVRLVGETSARDICQEVFLALWDHPERFDPERGALRPLLVTIARRRCIDLLRRSGRRVANEERSVLERPPSTVAIDEVALAQLAGSRVREALARLPDAQREAVHLAYFGGLTFREVAAATGVSEGTAKSRIRLGLQRLAVALRPHEQIGTP